MNTTHKTGFLFQFDGSPDRTDLPAQETWHRTLKGALKAKDKNSGLGRVYKITSDDTSEKVG